MANKLCLGALGLLILSLFFPWHHVDVGSLSVTQGIFVGDETKPDAYLIVLAPVLLAALLGGLIGLKRFGRGLGITVTIFAIIGALLLLLIQDAIGERGGGTSLGGYLGILGVLLTLVAGLFGTVKPDPKRA